MNEPFKGARRYQRLFKSINMLNSASNTGNLYIIAAPSGAGKTSLVKALVDSETDIEVSISYTTRAKRPGEADGEHYYFVDKNIFNNMVKQDLFLEHAQVFDNFYGTSRQKVEDKLKSGVDVILEIDWQGAQQVRKSFQSLANPCCTGIFILPPSKAALNERLHARGQDNEEIIARRMRDAVNEISHYGEFDYLLVNDVFDSALQDLKALIRAKRLAIEPQSHRFCELIAALLA